MTDGEATGERGRAGQQLGSSLTNRLGRNLTDEAWRFRLAKCLADEGASKLIRQASEPVLEAVRTATVDPKTSLDASWDLWFRAMRPDRQVLRLSHHFRFFREAQAQAHGPEALHSARQCWITLVAHSSTLAMKDLLGSNPNVSLLALPDVQNHLAVVFSAAALSHCGCWLSYDAGMKIEVRNIVTLSQLPNAEAQPPRQADAWVQRVGGELWAHYLRVTQGKAPDPAQGKALPSAAVRYMLDQMEGDELVRPVLVNRADSLLLADDALKIFDAFAVPLVQAGQGSECIDATAWSATCAVIFTTLEVAMDMSTPTPAMPADLPPAAPSASNPHTVVHAGAGSNVIVAPAIGPRSSVTVHQTNTSISKEELLKAFQALRDAAAASSIPKLVEDVDDLQSIVVSRDDSDSGKRLLKRSIDGIKQASDTVEDLGKLAAARAALFEQAAKWWPLVAGLFS